MTTDQDHADVPRFAADGLQAFTADVLIHLGLPADDAERAAEILLASDLRGIDSHGMARLPHYVEQLRIGRLNAAPEIRIVRETASTATIDGDNGMGLVVGPFANELAMRKARRCGSGWVAVRNTNHFGIAGYYPMRCAENDLIGLAMTNASSLVAPLWSADRMMGTNPLAIAFPAATEPPVVIDMATSAVAFGKIVLARYAGESIPAGWAVDAGGAPLTDPQSFDNRCALAPLGGSRETGGHKGYCLASMVDILCGVLSGACWGPFAPMFFDLQSSAESEVGKGLGHFFGAWSLDGFMDADEFKRRLDHWINVFRQATPAAGTEGPLIPGDPERLAEVDRRRNGIPLAPQVAEQLANLSAELGVAWRQ
ncbi:MAG: Ldh family oxidoreductase [Pirellulaceae bacterium]|jgi:LDH2 family malate/lactate/ureidoglycolate dehydrogenase|nr:Ldh family oxidoreductase [Pirellulaceae bacterium]MDP7016100.1 Ldh family oxidoreductase [Pirellulaceae bacterium]